MVHRPTSAPPGLQQLRYFATVIDEGSFTRAAKRLSISQPALSRQIALLERQLGARLLERTSSRVLLTVAGRAVLPEARAALASAQRAVHAAQEVARLEAGVLEIGTFPTLATGTLLPAIRRWHKLFPMVVLRLHEFRQRGAMHEAVRSGAVDFAVGTPPLDWPGPQRRVQWNELVVMLPPRDPLFGRSGPVQLAELAKRNWVLYERAYGLSDIVNAACLEAGFRPNGAIETSQAEAAAHLAAAGLGPALVPAANVPRELVSLSRRLATPVVWDIAAYTRSAWSPTALAFIEIVLEDPQPDPPADALRWDAPSV